MGKLLLTLSIICLLFLGIGTAKSPNDAMFWLASGSQLYQIVRGALVILLLVQVLTNPPRHPWLRLISGVFAVVVGAWTIQATSAFTMPALDTFAFLSTSVALLVTALEYKTVPTFVDGLA